MLRLSTAHRINSAADDAAGLAISERMRGQISGENMAVRNMRDSQSLYQTAEGGLQSTHSALQRMRELSVQANNSFLSDTDRAALQEEFHQLRESIDYVGKYTQFNGKNLLDGSLTSMKTTIDGNGTTLDKGIASSLASDLGLSGLDLRTNPTAALTAIDDAINQVSQSRGSIGATHNRLENAIHVSETSSLNLQAAESRIRDADMAQEWSNFNRTRLLQQTYLYTQKMKQGMSGQILNLFA